MTIFDGRSPERLQTCLRILDKVVSRSKDLWGEAAKLMVELS